jgi:hypothetical protein
LPPALGAEVDKWAGSLADASTRSEANRKVERDFNLDAMPSLSAGGSENEIRELPGPALPRSAECTSGCNSIRVPSLIDHFEGIRESVMSEVVPQFFFSYSQADGGRYLNRFFEELRKRVSDRSGLATKKTDPDAEEKFNKVGFRDFFGVETGQNWKEKIGAAIQHGGVLVCLYSPNFFSRLQNKQFCAREFTAFLSRHPDMKGNPSASKIPSTDHVLPILWFDLKALQNMGLPPSVLREIKWDLDGAIGEKHNNKYYEKGLFQLVKEHKLPYEDILNHFADRIIRAARQPLPPLSAVPDIEALPSAWSPDVEPASEDPMTVSEASPPAGGPNIIWVIEMRVSQSSDEWAPYGQDSIPALFEQIVNRKLLSNRPTLSLKSQIINPSDPDFATQMSCVLQETTRDSVITILVVDPRCFTDETARKNLVALLGQKRGAGFLVPVAAEDHRTTTLIDQHRERLKPALGSGWIVRIDIGNRQTFQTAATSVAQGLLASITKTGEVRQSPPDNGGPTTRPQIANSQESRA